jgi:PPP family 3-phenylpropionic acid transporter
MAGVALPSPTAFRLAFFFAAYFVVGGAALSWWPVWLADRGISPTEMGTIYMSRQFVTVAATLAAGWVANRLGAPSVLTPVLLTGAFVILIGHEWAYGFWPILITTLIWGATWHPVLSLSEGVAVAACKRERLDYGRVRTWGSVAFILGAVLCGMAVERWGPPWALYSLWIGVAITLPAVLLLPRAPKATREAAAASGPRVRVGQLLGRPEFLLFLLAAGAAQASHASIYSFGTLTWRAAGLSETTISLLWAEGVVAEIVLFWFSAPIIRKLGAPGLLILSGAAGLIRWTATAYTVDVAALAVLQSLHAFTFGATHLAAMEFLRRAVPERAMSLAQALYYGLAGGLLMALTFQFAGRLYQAVGPVSIATMAAMSAITLVAAIALRARWNGRQLVE